MLELRLLGIRNMDILFVPLVQRGQEVQCGQWHPPRQDLPFLLGDPCFLLGLVLLSGPHHQVAQAVQVFPVQWKDY